MESRLSDSSESEDERPTFSRHGFKQETREKNLKNNSDNDDLYVSKRSRNDEERPTFSHHHKFKKESRETNLKNESDNEKLYVSKRKRNDDERPSFSHLGFKQESRETSLENPSDNDDLYVSKRNRSDDERPTFSHLGFKQESRKRSIENGSSDNEDLFVSKKQRSNDNSGKTLRESEEESSNHDKKLSKVALMMMKKMGYKGKGLGRDEQGRREPVEAFKQKGRRGLGHDNIKLQEAKLKWDPTAEKINVIEEITWISQYPEYFDPLTEDEMKNWMKLGPKKETIDDEITFCDPRMLERVIESKSVFDSLDKHEMRRARTRSNPFETIAAHYFLNRAAVKMANINKACDSMFTKPTGLGKDDLLYFADVCAGPGGFSEYILSEKQWHAKGFGFTLKDTNDFKLDNFYAGPPQSFHPYYGPKEDGNVYDPENQDAFRQMVLEQTKGIGVHFMMADGGFSVEGKENIQEILSKQLYLCQCLVGLMIVREGGHFVTKLFDLFTPFSAGLVYLMYRCFKDISIFKPNTSRPANSERYLICREKLSNVEDIICYMSKANHRLSKNDPNRDVTQLVPLEVLESDKKFFDYLYESNNKIAEQQVVGLLKIAAYCEDTALIEPKQPQYRAECLEYWGLEDRARVAPRNLDPDDRLQQLISTTLMFMKTPAKILNANNYQPEILASLYDWYCVPCGSGKNIADGTGPTFYVGMGRTKVFRLVKNSWERVPNVELPPDTLILAEMVTELRGEYRNQMRTTALQIIDAYFLGKNDVSHLPLIERHTLINKFCEALWKPEYREFHRVRAKPLHPLWVGDIRTNLNLRECVMKNGKRVLGHFPDESTNYENRGIKEEKFFYVPNSVMFLKGTAAPWRKHLSRSTNHIYYFHPVTRETQYERQRPLASIASFPETFDNRIIWHWPQDEHLNIDILHEKILAICSNNDPKL